MTQRQIPAEIFPTRYRGTCHGLSAASGKLGSIVVQAFLPSIQISSPNSTSLAWVLVGFSFAMGLGAVFAWAWIPEVQDPRGMDKEEKRLSGKVQKFAASFVVPSKSLEELALGRAGELQSEKADVGFRVRGRRVVEKMRSTTRRRRKA